MSDVTILAACLLAIMISIASLRLWRSAKPWQQVTVALIGLAAVIIYSIVANGEAR